MRVLGIDPGTLSVDLCGIEDGHVILDLALPTPDALKTPETLMEIISGHGPFDLIAGPSGYGLPLIDARQATDEDLRLASLSAAGEMGGIGGLRALMRAMVRLPGKVVFTPGVIHLRSVPAHRKINRVDMGTADKLCAVVLAVHEQMTRRRCAAHDVSLILVELGGAFTSAIAVDGGQVVDGLGGSSGPLGARAVGALDGEVAYLMGSVTKASLFTGGAAAVAGTSDWTADTQDESAARAWSAYVESVAKAVAALRVSVPGPFEIVLSGRHATTRMREALAATLAAVAPLPRFALLDGYAYVSSHVAQGAALMADGLAGGPASPLVDRLGIRDASGSVLDHLVVITPEVARRRLGLN